MVKEKSRTSSVSDNIKIFEGLNNDRPQRGSSSSSSLPQRSHTQILHNKRSSQAPSSYVDLWICNSGENGDGVKVPDSMVKPAQQADNQELWVDILAMHKKELLVKI